MDKRTKSAQKKRRKEENMALTFTEERIYTEKDLQELFQSVNWLSANYPNRLKKALDHCETVITAWDGELLTGLINAIDDGELTAYVHYLCVNPAYQGKGVGRELLDRIKKKYQSYLYLILIAENEPLIEYYKGNGFQQIAGQFVMEVQNFEKSV